MSGQRYDETMLAWDEGVRWAYRIDRATTPIARAQVECTELADGSGGGGGVDAGTDAPSERLTLLAKRPIEVLFPIWGRETRGLSQEMLAQGSTFFACGA